MIIRFQFMISRSVVVEKRAKKSENHKICANFDHRKFIWEPKNFKTSFGYSFSGPIARKRLDHAPTLRGENKFHPPNKFFGGPHGVHKLDPLPLVKI